MDAPKPGIYPGIPAEDYHAWKAANYSTLKLFSKSAAHARESLVNPMEQTDAMALGSAVNDAVLQPDLYEKDYIVAPDVGDRRFKEAKAKWKDFLEESAGQIVLTGPEKHKIDMMASVIREHPICEKILQDKGLPELSFVWEDDDTGTLCKGRVDWYGSLWGNPVVCDLKSTRDASPSGWPKQIASFQYHVQAAFYLDGLATIQPEGAKDRTFLWLCVENASPFCTAVYQADPAAIDEGRRRYKNYLAKWTQCQETNIWAGYPSALNLVDIPHWAYTSDESEGIF